jgi:hypothetical protein
MNRHNPAMAKNWLDVAWGGPTATTSMGGMGGVVAGGLEWLTGWVTSVMQQRQRQRLAKNVGTTQRAVR